MKNTTGIGMQSRQPFAGRRNRLRYEKINAIERGDDFTTNEQLLQIVATAEPFVAEDTTPKIGGLRSGLV
jgi:hypothetical protein